MRERRYRYTVLIEAAEERVHRHLPSRPGVVAEVDSLAAAPKPEKFIISEGITYQVFI